MAQQKPSSLKDLPLARRYGLAIVTVALALGSAISFERFNFRGVEFPLFLFAIALTVWYAGPGPGILAVVLSSLSFNYFFTEPLYTFYVERSEIPQYVIFVLFAGLLAWFSAVRRRVEKQLLQSRNELQKEVAERTQQASLLNLTDDSIFVRDMSHVITYWNRGAEELYGWAPYEAVAKRSHDLLQTVFPMPIEDINAELLQTGRWEGEVRRTKADGTAVVVASRWSLRRDEANRAVAIMETNNDITDRKRREEEIRGLNQELEKRSADLQASNKELEAFAYSVSHDLRAPLRHMAGYAELLQKNASSALEDKGYRVWARRFNAG